MTAAPAAGEGDEARLLDTIAGIHRELRPGATLEVTLDTRLDRDLQLESLTRVELLSRIEKAFGVRLPDAVIAEADTPREILRALRAARPEPARRATREAPLPRAAGGAGAAAPADTATLVEALEWHADAHPERVHVRLLDEHGAVEPITYAELLDRATVMAGGLVAHGISPGDSVAIMLPTGREYLESFTAILLAGATPVPIYPPARAKQIEEHFRRHARILANAETRMLITFDQVKQVSRLLTARVPGLRQLVTPADLSRAGRLELRPRLTPENLAFLQYTSGSTGDPKGVVLTHGNILASLRCMRRALEAEPEDVFVSWLPLYHDMGLIGAWLGALVVGFPLVLMSPLTFLARPERWLEAVHRFGGTISGGPNFAYELCVRRIDDAALEGIDVSTWRLAFNGAEPVSPDTIARFSDRFAASGFSPRAMTPVYGLAEATLGVAFTPVGRGPRIERVSREALYARGRAEPATGDDDALALVSSGVPIPEFQVRVVDASGHEAPDRQEGQVEFKGPGTTSGYHRNPDATRGLFHGGWACTGDRGYLADGELYVTGRDKDVVIRAGRNLYPYDLEQAVAEVPGVRRGCVAVFGGQDPDSGTERLVVLAETRETDPARLDTMREAIASLTVEHLDLPADEIVLAPPQTVLKTSSGKIRRAALAERHARGALVTPSRAPWLQLVRLAADSVVPAVRAALRRTAAALYATWFGVVLGVTVAWAWPAVVLLPGARLRWRATRAAARAFLALAGIRLSVDGAPPRGARIVLASNHQSYLDGVVLAAALPEPVAFVAKRELATNAFARWFLDGLGVLYVDRFDRQRGVADSRHMSEALAAGARIAVFVEGTFHRMPGLLPFQLGAFELAVSAGAEIWPVVITGTRNVLRGDDWFARRSPVTVRFLDPLPAPACEADEHWSAAVALRSRTRERMLAAIAEPDLQGRDALGELKTARGGGRSG